MCIEKGVVIAEDDQQCNEHRLATPFLPGDSCEDIYNKDIQSREKPGYYWILKPDGPSRVYCGMGYTGLSCEDIYNNYPTTREKSGYYLVNNEWVYCDMDDFISSCAGVGGVWRRIASFNVSAGDECPSPWIKSSNGGVNFCVPVSTSGGCYSVIYSVNGISYQRVCGKASGYQRASPDGFRGNTIDNNYVDGLSITHGSPRQHIRTYAVGIVDTDNSFACCSCPCAVVGGSNPSAFVGSHYYCESGAGSSWDYVCYLSDVLWDGAGCSASNTCCNNPDLPWFYHQLSASTQDDIKVRSCMDESFENEAVLVTSIELYVQ